MALKKRKRKTETQFWGSYDASIEAKESGHQGINRLIQ